MGKLNWTSKHQRIAALTAAGFAALLLADVVYQTYKHAVWRRWISGNVAVAAVSTQPASTQPAGTQPAGSQPASQPTSAPAPAKKPAEISAALRKRNLFVAPKPTGHGLSLTGVLGRIAMFRNREGKPVSIEEGKTEGGVTVKSIDGYEVAIVFQGKPETMKLFAGGGAPPTAAEANSPRSDRTATPGTPEPAGSAASSRPSAEPGQLQPRPAERTPRMQGSDRMGGMGETGGMGMR